MSGRVFRSRALILSILLMIYGANYRPRIRRLNLCRLELDMFSGLLEAQRVSLTNSGQTLRQAKEALQTAATGGLARARWLMELSELRNLYDQARMAALDTEREYHQDMLAYRIDERTLLQRQAFAASRVSPLSKEDLDARLANLDQLQHRP